MTQKTIAIGQNYKTILWCVDKGIDNDGNRAFFVINGLWDGYLKNGRVYSYHFKTDAGAASIIWRGDCPFGRDEYNDAIFWINNQLRWGWWSWILKVPVWLTNVKNLRIKMQIVDVRNDSQRYKEKRTSFLYDDEEIPF